MNSGKLIAGAVMMAICAIAQACDGGPASERDAQLHVRPTQHQQCQPLLDEWRRTSSGAAKVRYRMCIGSWWWATTVTPSPGIA